MFLHICHSVHECVCVCVCVRPSIPACTWAGCVEKKLQEGQCHLI